MPVVGMCSIIPILQMREQSQSYLSLASYWSKVAQEVHNRNCNIYGSPGCPFSFSFTCTTEQFLSPSLRQILASSRPQKSRALWTNDSVVPQIEIPLVDHHTCKEAYVPLKKKVTEDMICAGEKEGASRS